MFNKKIYFPVAYCIGLFFFSSHLAADFRADLSYRLEIEEHSEEPDREISSLRLDLNSDYYSKNLVLLLDLRTSALVEHGSDQDNTTLEGNLNSAYSFNRQFSWIFDAQFSENDLESDGELSPLMSETGSQLTAQTGSRLTTETVTRLTTGPVYRYDRGLRGAFEVQLLTNQYDYEDSSLDATEDSFSLAYVYPLRESIDLISSLNIDDQRYRRSSPSINDARTESFRIDLIKQVSHSTISFFVEQIDIEFLNQENETEAEAYGMTIDHVLNSRSSLALEVSRNIQQVFSLSASPVNPVTPVSTSGLVENELVWLQYNYARSNLALSSRVYRSDISNISNFGVSDGRQEGVEVSYNQLLREDLQFGIAAERYKDEISDTDTKIYSLGFGYILYEASRLISTINIVAERRDENDIETDEALIEWIFEVKLF